MAFETMHQLDRNALQLPPTFAFPFFNAWLAQTRTHLPVLPPQTLKSESSLDRGTPNFYSGEVPTSEGYIGCYS